MNRLFSFIFTLLLHATYAKAQTLYFPKENYKDSTTLAAGIPLLAKQVIAQMKENGTENTLYHLFLLQSAAQDFQASNNTIDSLRKMYAETDTAGVNGFAMDYETYNLSKLLNPKEDTNFLRVFDSIYTAKYEALNKAERKEAGGIADKDVGKHYTELKSKIAKLKNTDSLSYKDARDLVEIYGRYRMLKPVYHFVQKFYASVSKSNYNTKDTLIALQDGSEIEALIATTDTTVRRPVVMMFTIYINKDYARYTIKQWADKGYVGMVAFSRGKGRSKSDTNPFEHEATDVYDAIDWISKQPYCNGKVGMLGGSFNGFTQWAAAKRMHPALKSIMPAVPVAPGIDFPFMHGIAMTGILNWIHYTTNSRETDYDERHDTAHWNAVYKKWYTSGAAFKSLDTIEGRPDKIFQRWLQHPYHDDFWKRMTSYDTDFAQIDMPVLTTTGYYDDEQSGALYYFKQHYLHNKKANHYLIIGPYDHGGASSSQGNSVYGYKIDSVARFNFLDFAVQWFDFTLKDSSKPAFLKDRVNYEVMGANIWKHVNSLEAMSNDTLTFYVTDKKRNDRFSLSGTASSKTFIHQTVNLTDRTDTTDINRMLGVSPKKVIDSVLQYRNSIVFETKPFDTTLIINNSFFGELKVAINKKDMDIAIYMYEQMPDGNYFSLGSCMQRASLAKDRSIRQLLKPNKKATIPVNWSYLTAKQVSKGSKLIFVVGINKSYQTEINYGTGNDVSDETIADAGEPLQIKWFGDSFIKVPVWR